MIFIFEKVVCTAELSSFIERSGFSDSKEFYLDIPDDNKIRLSNHIV